MDSFPRKHGAKYGLTQWTKNEKLFEPIMEVESPWIPHVQAGEKNTWKGQGSNGWLKS